MKKHISVMLQETLSFFEGKHIKTFFEGTLGAGGHAAAILAAHPEIERYIGCDRDDSALELAQEKLKPWKGKVTFVQANFSDLDEILSELGVKQVDGFFLISGSHRCKSTLPNGALVF